jgi:hypothetical protein
MERDRLKRIILFACFSAWFLGSETEVWAFRISSPADGTVVEAGSMVKVLVDPGEMDLLGVMFTASGGMLKGNFDSFPPYEWSIQIPRNYFGPLTFRATGRRFDLTAGPPPQSETTIRVVLPLYLTASPKGDHPPPLCSQEEDKGVINPPRLIGQSAVFDFKCETLSPLGQ